MTGAASGNQSGRAAEMAAPLAPEAALRIVLAQALQTATEPVALAESLGRVAAREVSAPRPIPPFDNSAMDGYALHSADTPAAGLRIVDESRAGHPAQRGPRPGEAVRISTGAMIPPGTGAVVPLEHVQESDGLIRPTRPVGCGENIRPAGDDVQAGQVVIRPGTLLGPGELGMLAAVGVSTVECAARPTVAVLTSGDELVERGRPLGPGQIHDSNSIALTAQVARAGGLPIAGGTLPDDRKATVEALSKWLHADILLVAGGISVGQHDHVKGSLAELGVTERFWRVALRPGGPLWFGTRADSQGRRPTLVFGLPGNPVSAMVTFRLFAQPALLAMLGLDPAADRRTATLASTYRKPPGRAHYLRCRLRQHDGCLQAHLTGERQGSHMLSSMVGADALAVIPAEREQVSAGERVQVELL